MKISDQGFDGGASCQFNPIPSSPQRTKFSFITTVTALPYGSIYSFLVMSRLKAQMASLP